ncbi:MAG: helix-turn-helix transcriptional regulator [Acidobacteria bacterium]|nr:helix-turn-helix transcriptional regulator [Acidobacteriota bacterium]
MEPLKNSLIDLDKIRELCEEKGLSQAELGRRIGLTSRDLITKRLSNKYVITGDDLLKIAAVLDVPVEQLQIQ